MPVSKEQILTALKEVMDPDFGKDLVSLNMVGEIHIEGNRADIEIVLTTPACPLKSQIEQDIRGAVSRHIEEPLEIHVHFDSRVTTMRQQQELLPGVQNIIAVASGKGGVGKSTISVNLALGLAATGARVGLLDADIYGPSIPLMMGLSTARPVIGEVNGKDYLMPVEKNGVKVLSIGFLVDEKQAIVWRGPMATSALQQFITDVHWGELDYLILDLPPGTGDIHLTLVQTVPVTGAVIVTTPQKVAMADARKAIAMFTLDQINVPVLGLVENMAWFTPAELPENKYYIFGKDGGRQLAEDAGIPYLGAIPLVQDIREGGDNGLPAVLQEDAITRKAFEDLAHAVAQQVSIRNATREATRKVEIQNG